MLSLLLCTMEMNSSCRAVEFSDRFQRERGRSSLKRVQGWGRGAHGNKGGRWKLIVRAKSEGKREQMGLASDTQEKLQFKASWWLFIKGDERLWGGWEWCHGALRWLIVVVPSFLISLSGQERQNLGLECFE